MGCKLAETQMELTPMQRFVYILAKNEHTPDELKEPSGMQKGNDLIKSY